MIYLAPEVKSGLGEDTYWTWAERTFPGSFDVPKELGDNALLHYSTLGMCRHHGNTISLCWELYPEMREKLNSNKWDATINRTFESAASCRRRVVSTKFAVKHYEPFGKVDVLPIGVDTDLFRPLPDRMLLRHKYGLPDESHAIGFWMGTNHPMKGADRLAQYANENPDVHWIVVWKSKKERGSIPNSTEFVHVSQEILAELMNCADFLICPGRLSPYFMVEWEAMACDLPVVNLGPEKDFVPSEHPREDILRLGWDRKTARERWLEYIYA